MLAWQELLTGRLRAEQEMAPGLSGSFEKTSASLGKCEKWMIKTDVCMYAHVSDTMQRKTAAADTKTCTVAGILQRGFD